MPPSTVLAAWVLKLLAIVSEVAMFASDASELVTLPSAARKSTLSRWLRVAATLPLWVSSTASLASATP